MTLCLLIACTCFSQSTLSKDFKEDTLFSITAAQLRATVRIFAEHDFLKTENALLNEQVSYFVLQTSNLKLQTAAQQSQIAALNEIIKKKDAIQTNSDAIIANLKSQIAAEQRNRKKYFLYGAGAGAAVVVLIAIIK